MKSGAARTLPSGLPVQPNVVSVVEQASPLDVVARLAGQVGTDVELYQLLGEIAHATRNLLDIDRVSIFILDGDKLLPVVSASKAADDQLWATFRALPPVALDVGGMGRALLASPRAVLIDARVSPVVPEEWREAFGLTSLSIVPLHAGGVPRGVLIGDSSEPSRAKLTHDQLQALETVASLAGLAVGRYDAAASVLQSTRALVSAVRRVSDAKAAPDLARAAANGFQELLDAASTSVAVFGSGGSVEFAGSVGEAAPDIDWRRTAERLVGSTVLSGHAVIHEDARVLVGCLDDGKVVAAAQCDGVASLGTGGHERVLVLADQVRSTVLHRRWAEVSATAAVREAGLAAVAAAAAETDDAATVVERFADPLRVAARAELLEIVVHGRARAQMLGLRTATGSVGAQIARWRRQQGRIDVEHVDSRALVPLVVEREAVGALVARISADTDLDALQQAATTVATLFERLLGRAELIAKRSAWDVARAQSRLEAVARRTALEYLDLANAALGPRDANLPRNGIRTVADLPRATEHIVNARAELTATEDVLLNLANVRGGLGPKLRALARAMSRPSMRIDVKASGLGTAEPPETMRLIVGVREVLGLATAARASYVVIKVRFEPPGPLVEVRADGRLSLASGAVGPSSYHVVRTLQRDLEAYGTRVELDNDGNWFTVRFRPRVGSGR